MKRWLLILMFVVCSGTAKGQSVAFPGPGMPANGTPPAFTLVAASNSGSTCTQGPLACTFTVPTIVGSVTAALVSLNMWDGSVPTVSSVTDSASDVFTQAFCTGALATHGNQCVYYACRVSAGVTSITVNLSSAGDDIAFVHEVSGLSATGCLDQHTADQGGFTSSPFTSVSTPATTQASEYLFGDAMNAGGAAATWAGTNGWNMRTSGASPSNATQAASFDKVVSATGAQNLTGTVNQTIAFWANLATFK